MVPKKEVVTPARSIAVEEESYHTAPENTPQQMKNKKPDEGIKMEVDSQPEAQDEVKKKAEKPVEKKAERKRKWGSTRVSNPSTISISTDSLKDIIDIKPGAISAEPILDLDVQGISTSMASELQELEDDIKPKVEPKIDGKSKDVLRISRTVVQDVSRKQDSSTGARDDTLPGEDKRHVSMDTEETPALENGIQDSRDKAGGDGVERRIVEKDEADKPLTLLPVDEPEAPPRAPSPSRRPASCIVHVRHLVRPYTLGQLKELLSRTGTLAPEGFWIDKIKSHCLAIYESEDQAAETRQALHGSRWPSSNPKVLWVDFATQDEFDFYKRGEEGAFRPKAAALEGKPTKPERPARREKSPERPRDRTREKKRDDVSERERARENRRQDIREWDKDKIRQSASRSRSRSPHTRKRRPSGERPDERGEKRDKREKKVEEEEPPAKLLDDLFRKTKATPCIYWLPLTEEQIVERDRLKQERAAQLEREREERIKRNAEERKLRDIERQERMRDRPQRRSPAGRSPPPRDRRR